MHDAKIQTERKMRQEVEQRLQSIANEPLLVAFGKPFMDKIRIIGRIIKQHEDEKLERRESLKNVAGFFDNSILQLPTGEMDKNEVIQTLRNRASDIEYNLPLTMFKTKDPILQFKWYISVYYTPLLTDNEMN